MARSRDSNGVAIVITATRHHHCHRHRHHHHPHYRHLSPFIASLPLFLSFFCPHFLYLQTGFLSGRRLWTNTITLAIDVEAGALPPSIHCSCITLHLAP